MAETAQNKVVIYTQKADGTYAAVVVEVASDPTTTNIENIYEGTGAGYRSPADIRGTVAAAYDFQTQVVAEVAVNTPGSGHVPTAV
jgi:hypothetical protein